LKYAHTALAWMRAQTPAPWVKVVDVAFRNLMCLPPGKLCRNLGKILRTERRRVLLRLLEDDAILRRRECALEQSGLQHLSPVTLDLWSIEPAIKPLPADARPF
jgi:hypothetical protein